MNAVAEMPPLQAPGRPTPRLLIYGCGKMAEAMLSRWLATASLTPESLTLVVRRLEHAAALAEATGARVLVDASGRPHAGSGDGSSVAQTTDAISTEVAAAVAEADLVLVAVKPQQLTTLTARLATAARPGQLWISVLAGISLGGLSAALPVRWQRWMPNTPCRVGRGLIARCGESGPDAASLLADALLPPLGVGLWLPEAQFDAFTAVAGSGPAYVFAFAEALAAAGTDTGLDPAVSTALARDVVVGAAALLAADPRSPAVLRAEVTSKGGTTEAALRVLLPGEASGTDAAGSQGLTTLLAQAVAAAASRSRAIGATAVKPSA